MSAADDFRRELAKEIDPTVCVGVMTVVANSPCICGCGLPSRVDVKVDESVFMCFDPAQVDGLIDMLVECRGLLWGPRPQGEGG